MVQYLFDQCFTVKLILRYQYKNELRKFEDLVSLCGMCDWVNGDCSKRGHRRRSRGEDAIRTTGGQATSRKLRHRSRCVHGVDILLLHEARLTTHQLVQPGPG